MQSGSSNIAQVPPMSLIQSIRDLSVGESGKPIKHDEPPTENRQVKEGRLLHGNSGKGCKVISTTYGQGRDTIVINYQIEETVGSGSFGVVFKATWIETEQVVAIKKVLQDKRFKNREMQIMKTLDHPNIVKLLHCFLSHTERGQTYLHLVLEYIPNTVYRISKQFSMKKIPIPMLQVKLYVYQMLRALASLHKLGICHRDIKPQNLLVDTKTHILKLCDFGSAKQLVEGGQNIAYICSRYYRAPELIFGATKYTTAIDLWSVGCVMAELLTREPLFPGENGVDQLVEIIKVLGAPSSDEIFCMNPNHNEFIFPSISKHSLEVILTRAATDNRISDDLKQAIDLVSKLLVYKPASRLPAIEAMAHPYFDELRQPGKTLQNGEPLPPLFNWQAGELEKLPLELWTKLQPQSQLDQFNTCVHMESIAASSSSDSDQRLSSSHYREPVLGFPVNGPSS